MKNRKLKFFVPVSVFMFAIAAAFASNTPKTENVLAEPGYIFKDNVCQRHGSCENNAATVCTHNGMQVFGLTENNCLIVLFNDWRP